MSDYIFVALKDCCLCSITSLLNKQGALKDCNVYSIALLLNTLGRCRSALRRHTTKHRVSAVFFVVVLQTAKTRHLSFRVVGASTAATDPSFAFTAEHRSRSITGITHFLASAKMCNADSTIIFFKHTDLLINNCIPLLWKKWLLCAQKSLAFFTVVMELRKVYKRVK